MIVRSLAGILLACALFLLVGAGPARAQWENIDTVEGAYGQKITLTKQPYRLAEGLSVRAMAIAQADTARWALSLIGISAEDTISVTYGGEPVRILHIQRPTDGVGPTKVFVSKETFLTMAETATVRVHVGDVTAALPAKLRGEMRQIFRRVN